MDSLDREKTAETSVVVRNVSSDIGLLDSVSVRRTIEESSR